MARGGGIEGKDVFWAVAALALAYGLYRAFNLGAKVGAAAGQFWEGVTFDPDSLGPPVELTPAAQLSREDYIRLGYMTSDGRLTAAGERYANSMAQLNRYGPSLSREDAIRFGYLLADGTLTTKGAQYAANQQKAPING